MFPSQSALVFRPGAICTQPRHNIVTTPSSLGRCHVSMAPSLLSSPTQSCLHQEKGEPARGGAGDSCLCSEVLSRLQRAPHGLGLSKIMVITITNNAVYRGWKLTCALCGALCCGLHRFECWDMYSCVESSVLSVAILRWEGLRGGGIRKDSWSWRALPFEGPGSLGNLVSSCKSLFKTPILGQREGWVGKGTSHQT